MARSPCERASDCTSPLSSTRDEAASTKRAETLATSSQRRRRQLQQQRAPAGDDLRRRVVGGLVSRYGASHAETAAACRRPISIKVFALFYGNYTGYVRSHQSRSF